MGGVPLLGDLSVLLIEGKRIEADVNLHLSV